MKLVIADHNDLFRSLLKFWMSSDSKLKLVGETVDGANLLDLLFRTKADLLVIDPAIPKASGLTIARRVHETIPGVRLLALYQDNKPYVVDRLQKAGFNGCVCKKNNCLNNLRTAIESIMEGNAYFCAETCRIQNQIYNNTTSFSRLLSLREQEILRQIGYGKNNGDIALTLKLSSSTVQTHRRNLFKKLGIHDTPDLMRYAIDQGFCLIEEEKRFA